MSSAGGSYTIGKIELPYQTGIVKLGPWGVNDFVIFQSIRTDFMDRAVIGNVAIFQHLAKLPKKDFRLP